MKNKILYRRHALVTIQKTVRGYLVKKKHQPRIKALRNMRGLDARVKQLESITAQLKNKESSVQEISALKVEIKTNMEKMRKDPNSAAYADTMYAQLIAKVNKQMASLEKKVQEQKNAEEQERLRKIQAEIEREKKRKEEEQRKQREEEENRKKKQEMEAKRKKEEDERRKQVNTVYYYQNLHNILLFIDII